MAREAAEALAEAMLLRVWCAAGAGGSWSRSIDTVEPDATDATDAIDTADTADAADDTVDIDATDERCDIAGDPPPLRGSPCTEEAGVEPGES